MQPEVTYVEWNGSWRQFCEKYHGQNVFTHGPFCLETLPMNPNAILLRMDIVPLPCPFCGSECRIDIETFSNTLNYRVRCVDNYHALDWWEENENDAIKVWNERK